MENRGNTLYLVVPCYNEECVLEMSCAELVCKIKNLMEDGIISEFSKILFVNDGSSDRTWEIIKKLHDDNKMVCGLGLSKNVGHQNAVLAGMLTAKNKADVIITIDADLQQDIKAINCFLKKYNEGCEIVYGIRNSRSTDSILKKTSALLFYKIMNLMGVEVMKNHADYRLMSRKAVESLEQFKEVNLFLRGIIPMVGYQSGVVHFDVKERAAGKSKYTLSKMLKLASDGITSLSIRPIRLITGLGFFIFIISIIMVMYSISVYIQGKTVPGWTSNLCVIWSIGGIQLLSLGIIGEYIGKIYLETKHRPRYIIEDLLWEDE